MINTAFSTVSWFERSQRSSGKTIDAVVSAAALRKYPIDDTRKK